MKPGDGTQNLARIGQLAAALDTTTKTLRHYEKMGLISPVTSHKRRLQGLRTKKTEQSSASKGDGAAPTSGLSISRFTGFA